MGEAIIARGQTAAKNVLDDVPIVDGYCKLLVRVVDNRNSPIANLRIRCTDGKSNYNYNTNARGYALFTCNSGTANFNVTNYSIIDNYIIADHQYTQLTEDAPVGTKKEVLIKLKKRELINFPTIEELKNRTWYYLPYSSYLSKYYGFYDGNFTMLNSIDKPIEINALKFLDTNIINAWMIGGGGGGMASDSLYNEYANGGGGGAMNCVINYPVDNQTIYPFIIGNGGRKGNITGSSGTLYYYGTAGSPTTAFDKVANGGSGNGVGGIGDYPGGNSNEVSSYFNINDNMFVFGAGGLRGNTGANNKASSDGRFTNSLAKYIFANGALYSGFCGTAGYGATNANDGEYYGRGGGGGVYNVASMPTNYQNTGGYGRNAGNGAKGCILIRF